MNGASVVTVLAPSSQLMRRAASYYSLDCDGNDVATAPDHASQEPGASDFTVEFWFQSTGAAAGWEVWLRKDACYSFQGYNPTGEGFISFFHNNGVAWIEWSAQGDIGAWDGGWHHLAGVFDRSAGTAAIYLDGTALVLDRANPTDANDTGDGTTLAVGAVSDASSGALGYIADVRITMSTVYVANFTAPSGPLGMASAAAGWNFRENAGTTVADASGNGNTLTFGAAPNDPAWGIRRW